MCKDIGTLLLVYSLAFSKRSTATEGYICLGCETHVSTIGTGWNSMKGCVTDMLNVCGFGQG